MVLSELENILNFFFLKITAETFKTQQQCGAVRVWPTSVSVLQSSWPEEVSAALCFLLTFTCKSQGFVSNICCGTPCVQFAAFSLFAASEDLPFPVCFLRATVRWWVFLLQDTTRLTRPGMFPERLAGCLGGGDLKNVDNKQTQSTCCNLTVQSVSPTSSC